MTLLAEPAEDEADAEAEGPGEVLSVLTALRGLDQQCRIFQRSAEQLGEAPCHKTPPRKEQLLSTRQMDARCQGTRSSVMVVPHVALSLIW